MKTDNGRNPFWGIIHVPHINDGPVNFNKSLAGFLATAGGSGTPFGYGVGFEYPCEDGGWLTEHPELDRPVGEPAGPPKESVYSNEGKGKKAAVFTRVYKSGERSDFQSVLFRSIFNQALGLTHNICG